MDKLSIKIKISGRVYPMTVSSEEEKIIREIANLLNNQIKYYKEQLGTDDDQDLLAIIAFNSALELYKLNEYMSSQIEDINTVIAKVNTNIEQSLCKKGHDFK